MRIELRSKLIDAAEYDASQLRLKLFLTNGQIREFVDVPAHEIDALAAARSPGSYYLKSIKDRYQPSTAA
ncbi:KTSC domain-containing protein [Aliirhizobium cellulosilyticum]|uniref:KTSC domain-containing protein n=1 Tax=Aliirhizobium cellulosilyticum TaxID=393664 RepID=A0A7W6X9D4_9HYPH|nr:KTSC domain-containing protein [Rhizobium cellulosilyticum]MBB4347928.1 hypothetical protein [Rhizobium cellulosilyticum]MBB4409678.1 hypothetical protein [Rhizobium cellulosilyticum]MBB4444365.1 hypothetical protein [Rhizobium cellulosilyticum]